MLNDARVASLGIPNNNVCTTRINKEKKFKIKFQVLLKFAQILPDYTLQHQDQQSIWRTDELPNQALHECATEISPAITAIFQKSVDTGELTEDWRDANIAPVFKKGDRHVPENYRPVSLTSVLSKKLEHIICHHMLNHLDENKVLTSLNHGFRSVYYCETQLVVTTHDLLNFYDLNKQVDTVILDFSKAFDTVPHRKLLHKLEAYRIRRAILQWISCFLTQLRCALL